MAGKDLPVSPLALPLPELPPVPGVSLGSGRAEIRYKAREDVTMMLFPAGTTVAGVFTRNKCPGAPIDWCRAALKGGKARALVVTAGNSNVFTGKAGRQTCSDTAKAMAGLAGCKPTEVFLASTGVIGEKLPTEKLLAALPPLFGKLDEDGWAGAASAIMTTDTFPKAATRTAQIGDTTVTVSGIAKGSGMIAPDMATMLCFLATDAKVPAAALQAILAKGTAKSFNCVTVDSDTSTSDTVLLFATGSAKHPRVPAEGGKLLKDFARAVHEVLMDLALMVARDGEGAQKLIQIDVSGAVSAKSAHRIAMSIANSPLVKTAIAGEDANWGRIVMAVGKAGEPADRDLLSVAVGGTWMAREGAVVPDYDETPVVAHMKGREVAIAVDLGLGRGKARVWTCDLTHGYIDINGAYRS
ncbi:bifunctional glutamate N-acetyltransferase/amino-acid acetyltransferase ArgJ [Falsiroseomonas selenitidurans]|uniref:Arginine biosynthesis bifunctional protein ArgJ n=1 Tax=Falsiroseomonas selenitidurans TaxID=2716335 RepID=A0ABX1E913_9PROT|nr:bifunctional glutamate N-acetyltransferase/amino-acid acetyltransferase ArgJ [Falsiroseomonas selenitidurans]NKC33709.1 bifunctional glutamate N-acetyltransferase/amino-acid acetyltransferase ArgJ [Falsiroseomonas selenitidurans]OYW09982.1 MAG: bifunctional ornithine acetyltransferase/N-acetylglutamate synthase [Rhodospirillales bacterium 12-71-4]